MANPTNDTPGCCWVRDAEGPVALVVRGTWEPGATAFLTGPAMDQQLGFIVRARGCDVPRHMHRAAPRTIRGCPECVIVRRGRCEVTLYGRDREVVATHELAAGDLVLLLAGGHGFRMLEDCVLMETRAGPFPGDGAKEMF